MKIFFLAANSKCNMIVSQQGWERVAQENCDEYECNEKISKRDRGRREDM